MFSFSVILTPLLLARLLGGGGLGGSAVLHAMASTCVCVFVCLCMLSCFSGLLG